MKRPMKLATLAWIAVLANAPVAASHAHTVLLKSTPKHGATLRASPPVIEIEFREPARLTSVVVKRADAKERRLQFTTTDKPTLYKVSEPKLESGRNEVVWKALSKDGHVVGGSLMFVIDPAAK